MKYTKMFAFLFLILFPIVIFAQSAGDTLWAKSTVVGANDSYFVGVANDGNGNSYSVGYIYRNIPYNFGNGVAVTGPYDGDNIVLVKYDVDGNAVWAKTMVSAPSHSRFTDVATDVNGDVYVVGYMESNGVYNLGNGKTVSGFVSGEQNIFIVKYDSSGNALWAKSTTAGTSYSQSSSVAVDSNGDVYVAGFLDSTDTFGFGDGVTAAGSCSSRNLVLIKYSSSGTTEWAKTLSESPDDNIIESIALDDYNDIHVAGMIKGTGTFNFGSGVSLAGIGYSQVLLAKYNTTGNAQWAKTATSAPGNSGFYALGLDKEGNIFGGGFAYGTGAYGFGNGVSGSAPFAGGNALLVKYNSIGDAVWARCPTTASGQSAFHGIAVDDKSNIYPVGYISGTGQYSFGNSRDCCNPTLNEGFR